MPTERIYRVTARGRFKDLDAQAHAYLARHRAEHDIFESAYTSEGTFTYDADVRFFSLRYEVRTAEGSAVAAQIGEEEANLFLKTLGYSSHPLKINVVDASAMWGD